MASRLTLSFKGKVLKVFPLEEGEMIIGSDAGCPLHIDSLAVRPRHATVITTGSACLLRDLNTPEGTFVNGKRIVEHPLKGGDVVQVGKHTLEYTQEADLPGLILPEIDEPEEFTLEPIKPPKSAWLQILTGVNLGKTISLNRQLTNIGIPGIQTAVIAKRNEGYFFSHLEGEHPPRIGDTVVGDRAYPLKDGDVIQMGNVKMQFYYQ